MTQKYGVTIRRKGLGFEVGLDLGNSRMTGVFARRPLEVVRCVEHYYGGAEQTNHAEGRLSDCPLCRRIKIEQDVAGEGKHGQASD